MQHTPGRPDRRAPRRRRGMFIALFATLVVIAGGAGAGIYVGHADHGLDAQTQVRAVIDNFYADLQRGDLAKVRSAMCQELADAQYKDVTEAAFANSARESVDTNGTFVVDWYDDVSISGDRAEAKFTGHSIGGTGPDIGDERGKISLTRAGDEWQICKITENPATALKRSEAVDRIDIQTAIGNFYDTVNRGELAAVLPLTCGPLADQLAAFPADEFRKNAMASPEIVQSVDNVTVNGDSAKATVSSETPQSAVTTGYVLNRIGADWKLCEMDLLNVSGGAAR